MFGGFYEGRNVLVTGLSGAKGTWVGWYLLEAGAAKIIGVDNARSPEGSCFSRCGLGQDPRVVLHTEDVRMADHLTEIAEKEQADAALHLAAMAIVGECSRSPLETYSVNAIGTASFMESVWRTGIERAVVVTTDKVYRDKGGEPWVEDDALVASGPYAVSKACADLIARDYYQMYLKPAGKRFAIARAGNVLVPGDRHKGRIFVDIADALAAGEPPVIMNPAFTRPYTFVGDTVSGYLWLLAQSDRAGVDGEAFNFGPIEERGVPNADLATKMCYLWGSGITWERGTPRDEPFAHQSLDCTKARERLHWHAAYTLDQGLAELVTFEKALAAGATPPELRALAQRIVGDHVISAGEQGIAWAV